jgi:hypothetical protein
LSVTNVNMCMSWQLLLTPFPFCVVVIIRWAKWWPCHHWREDRERDSETLAKIFDSRQPIKFLNQIAHKIIWIELSLYPDHIPNSNQRYPDF